MAEFAAQAWELFFSERFCFYRNALAVLGAIFILRKTLCVVLGLCSVVKAYFLAPLGIFRMDLKKYGAWAVVTGASEGIGRGYALELAKRGLNVVIMSRSEEKLQKVANEIKEKYGVEVRVIAVDFSSGQEVYFDLAEEIKDLEVGVLVNNVGMSYEHADFFLSVSAMRLRSILEVNCQSMVQMTRLILPKMLLRKKGVIINISSGSATFPFPLLTVYSASKAFVDFFSEGLRKEYSSKGIVIQCMVPFYVATAMSRIRRASFFVPSPTKFARSALCTLGHLNYGPGYFPHALEKSLYQLLPRFIQEHFTWKMMCATREKALRKKTQQKRED